MQSSRFTDLQKGLHLTSVYPDTPFLMSPRSPLPFFFTFLAKTPTENKPPLYALDKNEGPASPSFIVYVLRTCGVVHHTVFLFQAGVPRPTCLWYSSFHRPRSPLSTHPPPVSPSAQLYPQQ